MKVIKEPRDWIGLQNISDLLMLDVRLLMDIFLRKHFIYNTMFLIGLFIK